MPKTGAVPAAANYHHAENIVAFRSLRFSVASPRLQRTVRPDLWKIGAEAESKQRTAASGRSLALDALVQSGSIRITTQWSSRRYSRAISVLASLSLNLMKCAPP